MSFRTARRDQVGPILSAEEFARQGDAVRAAKARFRDMDAVRGFLNNHHDRLGGRPLDVAVASAAGLAAVEAECAQLQT